MIAADVTPGAPAFETAAEHATGDVPLAGSDDRAGDVRAALAGRRFESAATVAVVDDGRLVGLVAIEDLLAAPDEQRIDELMDASPPVVEPGVDQELAAWRMVRHGEASLAVVDADGAFRGLVPPQRMLAVLLEEHDEDMARLGGFLAGSAQARNAAGETVPRRLWHRLPWLLIGLAGAMLAAGVVAAFEDALEEAVLLAFFVPGVVYMADAVGTQTETLVIRGMAVGVSVRSYAARELATGALAGAVMAGLFFAFAMLVWGDEAVAASVALALLVGCSAATAIAMALPVMLRALGRDPAFGAGPLATVIQDLITVAAYFGIASLLV